MKIIPKKKSNAVGINKSNFLGRSRFFTGLAWSSKFVIELVVFGLLLPSCTAEPTQSETTVEAENKPLTIWWERGYSPLEDEAIETIVANWQEETGESVNLVLVNQDDFVKNLNSAFQSDTLPDIMFSVLTDYILNEQWAKEGKLADVSEVVEPVKDLYSTTALESGYYYNEIANNRSLYAIPLHQRGVHTHYWKDLLIEADMNPEAIPDSWDEFWDFWKQAQDRLRAKGYDDIYALGLSMSSEASDTHYTFEKILDAYDVQIWDAEGNLRLEEAEVRQGIIQALRWYTDLYRQGYVPPEAVNWANGINNTTFLNQEILMTINPSLSIPASQREDKEVYQNQIVTIDLPKEPDGEILEFRVAVKQVSMFDSSRNPEAAKSFLSYLIRPDQLGPYLETSQGRYFPVMPKLTENAFWNDPDDPHIAKATQQIQGETVSHGQSTYLLSDAVWGKALEDILVNDLSVEEAADGAIARIQNVFAD